MKTSYIKYAIIASLTLSGTTIAEDSPTQMNMNQSQTKSQIGDMGASGKKQMNRNQNRHQYRYGQDDGSSSGNRYGQGSNSSSGNQYGQGSSSSGGGNRGQGKR